MRFERALEQLPAVDIDLYAGIDAGDIDATQPIQIIAHSAGGFVAANCAADLLRERHPTKLQVTTLDTPFLSQGNVTYVKNQGGKFERYISSVLGVVTIPPLATVQHWPDAERSLRDSALACVICAFQRPPKPAQIAKVHERILRELGLGYRAPFLHRTAIFLSTNPQYLETIRQANYDEAKKRVLSFPGIGPIAVDWTPGSTAAEVGHSAAIDAARAIRQGG